MLDDQEKKESLFHENGRKCIREAVQILKNSAQIDDFPQLHRIIVQAIIKIEKSQYV